ncbi:MAG: hypothetical protein Q8P64_04430 [Deltaproteobacteria bacterium]|nr:hypothetical protein [Deltaproteobacteria bacterium]
MQSTMRRYANRIEKNQVNPHLRYDGKRSGLIAMLREKGCDID